MGLMRRGKCSQNTFQSEKVKNWLTETGEIAWFPRLNPARLLPTTHFWAGSGTLSLSLSLSKLAKPIFLFSNFP